MRRRRHCIVGAAVEKFDNGEKVFESGNAAGPWAEKKPESRDMTGKALEAGCRSPADEEASAEAAEE